MVGLDEQSMALWSRETTATPSATSCITEVNFGNILYDSAPVIVEIDDADPGTQVNLRYRSLNPGVWSDVQTQHLEPGQTQVIFDIYGLVPDHEYEAQTWLGDSRTPPSTDVGTASVAQTIFKTPAAPEGVTIRARIRRRRCILEDHPHRAFHQGRHGRLGRRGHAVGGGLRQTGDPRQRSRRQAPGQRPARIYVVPPTGAERFREADLRNEWRNGFADDREVRFTAPSHAGTFAVVASLDGALACLAARDDETAEDQFARCSARIEVTVVARLQRPTSSTTPPVNPGGQIPETLTDSEGVAYAVFTPVDGGSFLGDGYSLVRGSRRRRQRRVHRLDHDTRRRSVKRRQNLAPLHSRRIDLCDRCDRSGCSRGFGLRLE